MFTRGEYDTNLTTWYPKVEGYLKKQGDYWLLVFYKEFLAKKRIVASRNTYSIYTTRKKNQVVLLSFFSSDKLDGPCSGNVQMLPR